MEKIKTYLTRYEGNLVKSKIIESPSFLNNSTKNVLVNLRKIGKYGITYLEIKGECYAIGQEAFDLFETL